MTKKLKESFYAGAVGLIIAVFVTLVVHFVLAPSNDLAWSLIAVGFAGFFASFFSWYLCLRSQSKKMKKIKRELG